MAGFPKGAIQRRSSLAARPEGARNSRRPRLENDLHYRLRRPAEQAVLDRYREAGVTRAVLKFPQSRATACCRSLDQYAKLLS